MREDFSLIFARSARKEIEALEKKLVKRIWEKINALHKEPRPPGCRKLQGERKLWRIRIGDYRVLYSIRDKEHIVDIVAVRHRSKAYYFL